MVFMDYELYNLSRGGRMVIVPAFPAGGRGFDPQVEMLGNVSINHSLTGPRCKNCTRECGEDRIMVLALCGMFGSNTVPINLKVMAYAKVG